MMAWTLRLMVVVGVMFDCCAGKEIYDDAVVKMGPHLISCNQTLHSSIDNLNSRTQWVVTIKKPTVIDIDLCKSNFNTDVSVIRLKQTSGSGYSGSEYTGRTISAKSSGGCGEHSLNVKHAVKLIPGMYIIQVAAGAASGNPIDTMNVFPALPTGHDGVGNDMEGSMIPPAQHEVIGDLGTPVGYPDDLIPIDGGSGLQQGARPPAWTLGEIEPPAGEHNMGTWTAAVYTAEQQARLGVDEFGMPAVAMVTSGDPRAPDYNLPQMPKGDHFDPPATGYQPDNVAEYNAPEYNRGDEIPMDGAPGGDPRAPDYTIPAEGDEMIFDFSELTHHRNNRQNVADEANHDFAPMMDLQYDITITCTGLDTMPISSTTTSEAPDIIRLEGESGSSTDQITSSSSSSSSSTSSSALPDYDANAEIPTIDVLELMESLPTLGPNDREQPPQVSGVMEDRCAANKPDGTWCTFTRMAFCNMSETFANACPIKCGLCTLRLVEEESPPIITTLEPTPAPYPSCSAEESGDNTLQCGDDCTRPCPAGMVCLDVMQFCQADGTCGMNSVVKCTATTATDTTVTGTTATVTSMTESSATQTSATETSATATTATDTSATDTSATVTSATATTSTATAKIHPSTPPPTVTSVVFLDENQLGATSIESLDTVNNDDAVIVAVIVAVLMVTSLISAAVFMVLRRRKHTSTKRDVAITNPGLVKAANVTDHSFSTA